MRAYEASSFIEAVPDQVWPVLTDIAAWPDWDSGVTKVDGRLALGEKLSTAVEANPGRVFPVTVTVLSAPERMVFRGRMPRGSVHRRTPAHPLAGSPRNPVHE